MGDNATYVRSWYRRVPFLSLAPPTEKANAAKTKTKEDLFFTHLSPLLHLGYTRPLVAEDLPPVPEGREAQDYSDRIIDAFSRRRRVENGTRMWKDIAIACNDAVAKWFWMGGLFRLLADVGTITSPLLVKAITNFASSDAPTSHGVGLALGLLALQLVTLMFSTHAFHRTFTTGLLLRSGLIHSLFTSSLTSTHPSPGKLTSIISTDVSRIDFSCAYSHHTWTAPIQMIVCLGLLCAGLGWAALPGFAFFVGFSPVQGWVTKWLFRLRKRSMIWTDKRIGLLVEVLGNMNVVKMFAWEIPFMSALASHRHNEMRHLRNRLFLRSLNNSLAFALPTMAAVLSFISYKLAGNELDPAVIFSSLSLFNLLRSPLTLLPVALNGLADASNALSRVREVLILPPLKRLTIDPTSSHAVKVIGATFLWPDSSSSKPATSRAQEPKKSFLKTVNERLIVTKTPVSKSTADSEGSVESEKVEKDSTNFVPPPPPGPPGFMLRHINLNIPHGKTVAIVGPVGSGKSSLIQGLIGEMPLVEGSVTFSGDIAYCPQVAWIRSGTIRENILFGLEYHEERYADVVEAACLNVDFKQFENGDMTPVGEKGISLSGGQRQRVSIARLLYADRPINILDDAFSALDASTASLVFSRALLSHRQNTTRILVTHSLHLLPKVDWVVVMNEGVVIEEGTFAELTNSGAAFSRFLEEFGLGMNNSVDDIVKNQQVDTAKSDEKKVDKAGSNVVGGMQAEERHVGTVGAKVYWQFVQTVPVALFIPIFTVAAILFQGGSVMNPYWLVFWQENAFPLSQATYMAIYAALGICQGFGLFLMGVVFALFTYLSSQKLHKTALDRVLHAPMSFFHTTPLGRLTNRFSKDIDTIDNVLGEAMRMFLGTLVQIVGAIVLVSIVLPWFLAVVAVVLLAYYWIAVFYRSSARDFKRMDAILRSSLYSHFSESLSGITTIRVFGVADSFARENADRIDAENRAYWLTISNQRWLSIRLDFLGSLMVFFVALLAVLSRKSISASETGVALSYMLVVQQAFGWAVRQSAEVENNMNAVERLMHYAKEVPQEPPYELPEKQPPANWPTQGAIKMDRLTSSYRKGLSPVLKDVTIEVGGGSHVALIGRTGAGKSTVTQALYRTLHEISGKVTIDGVGISTIGLRDLRSALSIIPQEPILFSGTLRYNLDPFSEYTDAHLNDCLRRSWLLDDSPPSLSHSSTSLASGSSTPTLVNHGNKLHLDFKIEESGRNLSIGQRSLVSLARALAKDAKILILDEATASVDYETDRRIQHSLSTSLGERTLLCIAHRLRTIIGYDKIIVLDAGKVIESGEPVQLFQKEGSMFRAMCEKSEIRLEEIVRARQKRTPLYIERV